MYNRDESLKKEGWERKSVADEPRLSELVELYQSLGFEVHLELAFSEGNGECQLCFEGQPKGKYMVIYTRKKEASKNGNSLEDLFA